jgi:hypothetical protein
MNQLKNWAIALLGVLALSVNGWGCGAPEGETTSELDEIGELEQPILVESQFGWRSGDSDNGRCLSTGSIDCLIPRYKGMQISLGTGWTAAERTTLVSLFTANIQALRVAAPSWSTSNPIVGTVSSADCGAPSNAMCVQVNKVGGATPVGPVRPIAEFLTVKCLVTSAAIAESAPVNGTWKYCDQMAANISSAALLAWAGGTFSAGNNDLRQVTGHITALRAGLGTRNHSGVETMTSLNITKNVNANNSLFGNEACNIEHFICLTGAVGCTGLTAPLGVGSACPVEAL